MIFQIILQALYYFFPAYIANMTPPVLKFIPLNKPIDCGKKIGGKRIFGKHKTFRGFFGAVIVGTLIFYLQGLLLSTTFFSNISIIKYDNLWLGLLLSLGAITGDLIKSFFKRRMNIEPGKSWIPFDQLDFVIGAFIFSMWVFLPSIQIIIIIFLLTPILQMIAHYSGYILKLNEDKI